MILKQNSYLFYNQSKALEGERMKMKHSECDKLNNTAKGLPMFEKMKVNFFFQSDVNKKGPFKLQNQINEAG